MSNYNRCLERLGEERLNNQGYLMKIVEYIDALNITIEFQDKYQTKVKTCYSNFNKGNVRNPYHPSVYGVGMVGIKYPTKINGKNIKEYKIWKGILERCFDEKYKEKYSAYKDVTCCKEWLLYENFYEWLHLQENFDKWLNEDGWAVDKDILVKGNKIYSSDTCCLVPQNVNGLFAKCNASRGKLPIGVTRSNDLFMARSNNGTGKIVFIGYYNTSEDAFYLGYKPYKENLIKRIAEIEFNKGNIIEQCYKAMINYEVEITD